MWRSVSCNPKEVFGDCIINCGIRETSPNARESFVPEDCNPKRQPARAVLGLAIALLAAAAAGAGEPAATWDDCLQELIRNNPALQAAAESVVKARAESRAQSSPFWPQLSASWSAGKSGGEQESGYQDAASYQMGLSADWALFSGFGDLAAWRRSRILLDASAIALQSVKADLSATLRQQFVQLLYAQDFIGLSRTIAERRKENAALVDLRFEAGRENKGALLRSQAYDRQARFEAEQAQRGRDASGQQLAATLGRRERGALAVTGTWDYAGLPAEPDFERLAMETPAYRAAAADVRAALEGVRMARSSFYPTWSVGGSAGRSDSDHLLPERDQWSLRTALSYPLFAGDRHRQAARGAQADRRKAEQTLRETLNQAVAALKDRHTAWQDAVERTDVQQQFLAAAEVRAEIARAQYQNGLLSFEDWDLIENDLIDRQKAVLSSRRDAVIARANWERALGLSEIP